MQGAVLQAHLALLRQWMRYGLMTLPASLEPQWHFKPPQTVLCDPITQQWRAVHTSFSLVPESWLARTTQPLLDCALPVHMVEGQLAAAAVVRGIIDKYASAPHPHDRIIGFDMQAPQPPRKISPVQPTAVTVRSAPSLLKPPIACICKVV